MFAIPGCEAWTSSTVLLSMLCSHVCRQELCTRLLPLFADFNYLPSRVGIILQHLQDMSALPLLQAGAAHSTAVP